MSDTNLEDAGGPGREPQASEPSDAAAPMAAEDDEPAEGLAEVEPVSPFANSLPDHLQPGHPDVQSAIDAYNLRNRRYPSYGEALDAFNARRAANSRRLEAWLNGDSA